MIDPNGLIEFLRELLSGASPDVVAAIATATATVTTLVTLLRRFRPDLKGNVLQTAALVLANVVLGVTAAASGLFRDGTDLNELGALLMGGVFLGLVAIGANQVGKNKNPPSGVRNVGVPTEWVDGVRNGADGEGAASLRGLNLGGSLLKLIPRKQLERLVVQTLLGMGAGQLEAWFAALYGKRMAAEGRTRTGKGLAKIGALLQSQDVDGAARESARLIGEFRP